jgi:hypothetical protein
VDDDILETLCDFAASAEDDGITVELKNLKTRQGFMSSASGH